MDKAYVDIVRLLLEVMPAVFQTPTFALKGGTALNLFVRPMPRLSVDIDLVFVDRSKGREEVLTEIAGELQRLQLSLKQLGIESSHRQTQGGDEVKLLVRRARSEVKIEVNYVFRGTVLPVEQRPLVKEARDLFTTNLSVPSLAVPELYGGKIVAALDRQHPRDLFDIIGLYEVSGGLTPEIRECFVCYLAGHNRPVHEVLFSRDKDIAATLEGEFQGMTRDNVSVDELIAARQRLREDITVFLTADQRRFLISLVNAEPEWNRMQCPHLAELSAIRWKLENLRKLQKSNPRKFHMQAEALEERLR
jgi:hypothetical protein